MRLNQHLCKIFLLLLTPVFIFGTCSKEDAELPNADEYVTWKVGSQAGQFTAPADSVTAFRSGGRTYISAMPMASGGGGVFVTFEGPVAAGNYPAMECSVQLPNEYYMEGNTPVLINVTSYTNPGYVSGTYSGTLMKQSGNSPASVTGAFRIRTQ